MTLAAFHIGPIQFDQPIWLLLVPVCGGLALWIGRQTLSGMGTFSRRLALAVRLVVIVLLAGAVARPYWRREASNVNATVVVDESDSVRRPVKGVDGKTTDLRARSEEYLREAAGAARPGDTVARVTAAAIAYVQALAGPPQDEPETQTIGATNATNLAEAVNLAIAVSPSDRAIRILLISDGNQNAGDLMASANAARAAGIPIDVLPLKYRYDREVVAERLVSPATARMGQNANLRVLLTARGATRGRLTLQINGETVDLDDSGPDLSMAVALEPGPNAITVPISLPRAGPQEFRAVFTPDNAADDSIVQNNESLSVTFVQSEGRVLVLSPSEAESAALVQALTESKIAAEVRPPGAAPSGLVEWGAYDGVVMVNTASYDLSEQQQEDLKAYVHDLGGGLVMVGGPEAFGAGGWIGSPLADALPIKLDPPQKRQMPKGALVLVMHSCEMPQGNYWGKQTALAAVNNLSRQDLVGVLEFSHTIGDNWVYPLGPVGNRGAVTRAINSLTYGDMPTFDGLLREAIDKLKAANAGARHMIIISDGDPSLANRGLLTECRQNRISISTVLVYPHNRAASGPDWQTMKTIAEQTGGKFHSIIDEGEFAKLPSIFIKEAQMVKRSLIWEGPAFSPAVADSISEPMRGVRSVPAVSGYIVAADREGLSMVSLRGKENDPILAHWQYGLGKSVAFTADAGSRWTKSWPSWGGFRAFWEQHIRWAMRPGGSADMRVITEDTGDRTRVIVEALDQAGERLNFVRFAGRVVGPDGAAQDVDLRQVGPGRYEGSFESGKPGAYVSNFRYLAPPPSGEGGPAREGNLQAAVTRPFADEYRTLEDNSALLELVAARTGGRVLGGGGGPVADDLWSREGLTMPVATRSIWLLVALVGIGAFLADVAVRRVRLEPALVAAAVRRAFRPGDRRAGDVGSLQRARERARAGMGGGGPQDVAARAEQRRAMAQQAKADASVAHAKFEATAEELAKAKGAAAGGGGAVFIDKTAARDGGKTVPGAKAAGEAEEGGLSRLKRAKERAKGEFEE